VAFLVGLALGAGAAWFFRSRGEEAAVGADQQHERELKALLDEVRSLRQDIDILKVNPAIGSAVAATLQFAHDQAAYDKSAYAVAVRPTDSLPQTAYNVAVRPGPSLPGGDPARSGR